jgi:prepilin-type N-terminal cleavage/methylation domain-containing protein
MTGQHRHSLLSGFTLIELLIVVAIISILASIAVPNFLEAQMRAKVARVKADERSMATAIESYAVDNNKYPNRHDAGNAASPPFIEKILDPNNPSAAIGMHLITTPVAYMSSLPKDIFDIPAGRYMAPGNPYSDALDFWDPQQADYWLGLINSCYSKGKARGWMLMSVGPDQYLGNTVSGNPGGYPSPQPADLHNTWKFHYDPTNGTVSSGNIYRFAGDLGQSQIQWRGQGPCY